MLSNPHRELIKATVPALRTHGETITEAFYRAMLEEHPELLNYFNPANQRGPASQARSLAASVLAYAANIDALNRLGGMVERIANKHVSLDVRPEHYLIVGTYLLRSIADVLGPAATPEILDAWRAAYGELAAIMTGRECKLYADSAGGSGWPGFKSFWVEQVVPESEAMTSFYLVPEDGAELPVCKPGQYVSVKVHPPGKAFEQIRQYSLSAPCDGRCFRISVQREPPPLSDPGAPPGLVSNFLHDTLRRGSTLPVHAPVGDFVLEEASDRPVVLMSGGAGVTAVLAMLEHLVARSFRSIVFLRGVRSRARHPFAERVRELARLRPRVRAVTFYERVGPEDVLGEHYDAVGRTSADALRQYLPPGDADYYYCGPIGFMSAAERALDELQVPRARRHSEAFAPDPFFSVETPENPPSGPSA